MQTVPFGALAPISRILSHVQNTLGGSLLLKHSCLVWQAMGQSLSPAGSAQRPG